VAPFRKVLPWTF